MQLQAGDYHLKMAKLFSDKKQLDDALITARLTCHRQQKDVDKCTNDIAENEKLLKANALAAKKLEEDLARLATDRIDLNKQQQLLALEIKQKQSDRQEAAKAVQAHKQALADLQKTLDAKAQRKGQIDTAIANHQDLLKKAMDAKADLMEKAEVLLAKAELAAKERDQLKNQIDATERHVRAAEKEKYDNTKDLEAAAAKLAQLTEAETVQTIELLKQRTVLQNKKAELDRATEDFEESNRDVLKVANEVTRTEQILSQFADAFKTAAALAATGLRNATRQHEVLQGEVQKTQASAAQSMDATRLANAAKQMATTASQKHQASSAIHQQKEADLANRLEAVKNAAHRLSECTKNAADAQQERDRRIQERTEKRQDNANKEQQVRQQEEEKRRLESQRRGFWKIVSFIISALSRVCNLLGMLIPQLRAAGIALSFIEGIVSQVEGVVSQCADSLAHAMREQDEKDRQHGIAMGEEDRARHDTLLAEIDKLQLIGRANDATGVAANAERAHGAQQTSEERQKTLEDQLKGVSAELSNGATQAQSALDNGKQSAEEKKRDHEQADARRRELQKELRSANQEIGAATAEVTAAEQQLKSTATKLEETKAQKQALNAHVDMISGTAAAAELSLIALKSSYTDKDGIAKKLMVDAERLRDDAKKEDSVRTEERVLADLRAEAVGIAGDVRLAEQQKGAHEIDLKAAEEQHSSAAAVLRDMETQSINLTGQLDTLKETERKLSNDEAAAKGVVKSAEDKRSGLNSSLESANEKLTEAQATERSLSSKHDRKASEISTMEATVTVPAQDTVTVPAATSLAVPPIRRDEHVYS